MGATNALPVPEVGVFQDVLDTFYAQIRAKAIQLNPAMEQQLQGMSNAADWPQIQLVDGGLYLLYLTSVEVPEMSTKSQLYFEHFLQWAWVFIGDDIQANQVGANRANRFRSNLAMIEMLRQAHFPGFAHKQFSEVDPVTGDVTFTQYSPVEMIMWGTPRLGTKMANAQSGLLYGTAAIEIYSWSTVNPLMNL